MQPFPFPLPNSWDKAGTMMELALVGQRLALSAESNN